MMRSLLLATAACSLALVAAPVQADPLMLGPITQATGPSPFAPGCGGPGEASPGSVLYQNAEVETHLAVNPTDANNVVMFWQQDRWSDGGSHGDVAGYSLDGGATWARSWPKFTRCAGGAGTGILGDYQRATDPWLSFSPNGRLHAIAIAFDNNTARNAILAAFSNDKGATWSTPRVLRFDNPRAVGNSFNDKETLTAHPANSSLVYATWQRIVAPSEHASQKGFENAASFYSTAWFARSTNGGETWEPARSIYAERGKLNQVIGNQIQVLPDGTLINGFNLIHAATNRKKTFGYNVALVRSTDGGNTWSREILVDRLLSDPVQTRFIGHDVRTGDILPDWAVDWGSNPATRGNLYVVWMDTRFNDPDHNDILLARSEDGGLSWSGPFVVDKTPAGIDAFTPMVEVDQNGRVAVTYYDFRPDLPTEPKALTDFYVAHSHDGGVTFSENKLTAAPFDMATAPDAGGYFVGDYTGLDHRGAKFHAGWVQANDGNLANRTDAVHRTAE
jgi:hypothetical protein